MAHSANAFDRLKQGYSKQFHEDKPPVKATMKGGTTDFNWEEVRAMNYKDRECYLGYTTKLGYLDKGGIWKTKDWWTKGKDPAEQVGED